MAMAFSAGASLAVYSGSAVTHFSGLVGVSFASGFSNRAFRSDNSRQQSFSVGGSERRRWWGTAGRGKTYSEIRLVRELKVKASAVPDRGLDNQVTALPDGGLDNQEGGLDNQVTAVPDGGLDNQVTFAKGLPYDGPGRGGEWLSSTTRHVRLYIGVADPVTNLMDQSQFDKVTLMLDPDNEFIWPDDKTQKVYDYFRELLDVYEGAPCTEYTLRLIGSDLEHFIRKLLLANEIKYNLDCRVLNYSMGKPRYTEEIPDAEEEEEGSS